MNNNEHKNETYKSLITISTEGFKSLQYLNGGAVVTMLTYLGSKSNLDENVMKYASIALEKFLFGLFFATLVYVTSYLTQYALHNENNNRMSGVGNHKLWLMISFVLVLASLFCFTCGAESAKATLMELVKT